MPLNVTVCMRNCSFFIQLQRSSADVFCLQEVWLTETQRKVYQGVKDHYPYIVTSIDLTQDPNEDKSPACDGASIQLVGTCIATFCNDTDSQSACFIQHCQSILRQLSQPCLTCLTIGRRGLQCSADPAGLYKSSFGLMLLSKKKFTNVKVKSYLPDYASNLRGHIQANVCLSAMHELTQQYCFHNIIILNVYM